MEFDDAAVRNPLILVVDDDILQLNVSRDFLKQAGFDVECAQDGESALQQVGNNKPDLILLDVLMPDMDGYETCSRLRRMRDGEHIPVMMTTGMDDIKSVTQAYAVGATDFISKPINWLILEQRILYMLRASRALGSLHRSEMKNRALLDAIPDVMFHIDSSGIIIDYKGAAGFSLLIEPPRVAGRNLSDIFPSMLAGKIEISMRKAFETREPQTFEFIQTASRSEQYFESRIVICGDHEILVIMRDITERKRFEQALRISETKYRIVAENTYDWEFWLNPDGQFVYTSPSCQNVTGYSAAEFENDSKLFLRIVHPDDLTKCATHCSNPNKRSRKTGELEYRIKHRDGNIRWIGHVCQQVYDAEGSYLGIRGSNRDITEQKKAAALVRKEELLQIRHEEERKRLLEKDKILKDMHDGIGGIMTNIGLLAEMASNSKSKDYISTALRTMSELSREAITELRSFMNIIDERRLDWHAFVADLRNFGSSMTEGNGLAFNIKISVQSKAPVPESFMCLNIFRIYKEALTNIVKHAGATAVNVTISVKSKRFEMSVQDDGSGFTVKPGEGRGVMNMKSRAEEVGGSLAISCNHGTLVHLDFPIPIKYP